MYLDFMYVCNFCLLFTSSTSLGHKTCQANGQVNQIPSEPATNKPINSLTNSTCS